MQDAKNVKQRQFSKLESCRCLMGHFRLCALMLVEEIIKTLYIAGNRFVIARR